MYIYTVYVCLKETLLKCFLIFIVMSKFHRKMIIFCQVNSISGLSCSVLVSKKNKGTYQGKLHAPKSMLTRCINFNKERPEDTMKLRRRHKINHLVSQIWGDAHEYTPCQPSQDDGRIFQSLLLPCYLGPAWHQNSSSLRHASIQLLMYLGASQLETSKKSYRIHSWTQQGFKNAVTAIALCSFEEFDWSQAATWLHS